MAATTEKVFHDLNDDVPTNVLHLYSVLDSSQRRIMIFNYNDHFLFTISSSSWSKRLLGD